MRIERKDGSPLYETVGVLTCEKKTCQETLQETLSTNPLLDAASKRIIRDPIQG